MSWFISRHAMARAQEMGLGRDAILAVVEDPAVDCPSTKKPNCRVASRDDIAVVYATDEPVIVTVLWNGREVDRPHRSSKKEGRMLSV